MRKWMIVIMLVGAWVIPYHLVFASTILYVPIDDRPVSFDYTVDTARAADLTVLTPPREYLAGRDRRGDPEKLWQWVKDHCQQADSLVLSTDSLIYGGLVDSRTHQFDLGTLQTRLDYFKVLKQMNSLVKIYVYSTIMRSPQISSGGFEPPYYEQYGSDIFELTALQDKEKTTGLSVNEQKRLKQKIAIVPPEYLAEWLDRRSKNLKINTEIIELAQRGAFDYVIMGRDDSAPYSQAHHEWRSLKKAAAKLPASVFESFPGADQLGMILMARSYNELNGQIPFVKVDYAAGYGGATIPLYEDQPLQATIAAHVLASGGIVLENPRSPDLILAVNTPENGITHEADSPGNQSGGSCAAEKLIATIQSATIAGHPVAIADVAYANGADNAFMQQLFKKHLLARVSSYSGWNTASNKVGYAIGQGMLAGASNQDNRQRFLAVRYLEDWAYQANIRSELQRNLIATDVNLQYLNGLAAAVTHEVEQKERAFAGKYLWVSPEKVKITFPWNRTFEIKVELES